MARLIVDEVARASICHNKQTKLIVYCMVLVKVCYVADWVLEQTSQ